MTIGERCGAAAEAAAPSLETVFFEYYPRIVSVLDRILGDRSRAEEVALDTFAKFASQPLPFCEIRNVGGWLYRAATRLGIDALRADERRTHYERMAAREPQACETPLDAVLREERVREVRAALARLGPPQAQLLVLRSHGLSYRELADALNIKPASVGKLLARAQAAFEKAYGRQQ